MATLRPGPNHLAPKLDVFTTTATLSTILLVADSQLRVNEWMRRLNHGRKYGGPRNPEPRRSGVDGVGPSQATGEVLSVLEQFYHTIV